MTSGDGSEVGSPPEGERLSIGRYLASQRRLRGISLEDLATRTRIPLRNLERLESGAFDEQPDGFVRGFVRTVAEALGLDPNEAVLRLVDEPAAGDEERLRRRRLRRTVLVLGSAVLALLATLYGLSRAARWLREPSGDPTLEHVYRHDAVRKLVEQGREEGGAEEEAPARPSDGP